MKGKTVLILVLVALLAILLIQNSALIPFRLFFWSAYMPVFILVLGVFAVGLIIGYLAARFDRKRGSKPDSSSIGKSEAKTLPNPDSPRKPTAGPSPDKANPPAEFKK